MMHTRKAHRDFQSVCTYVSDADESGRDVDSLTRSSKYRCCAVRFFYTSTNSNYLRHPWSLYISVYGHPSPVSLLPSFSVFVVLFFFFKQKTAYEIQV